MSAKGNMQATTGKSDWETPDYVVYWASKFFNVEFDLDPAAKETNAKAPKYYKGPHYTELCECGLCKDWFGNVWLNPPYGVGVLSRWVAKVQQQLQKGLDTITLLLPANTGTVWFGDLMKLQPELVFIQARISFLDSLGLPVLGNTTDSMFVHLSSKNLYSRVSLVKLSDIERGHTLPLWSVGTRYQFGAMR